MFINVGAIFAPFAAIGIRNWWLNNNGFTYNPDLPALSHKYLGSGLSEEALARFEEIKASVGGAGQSLDAFATKYLDIFTTGYHYAFGIAVGAMVISLVIYLANARKFPTVQKKAKDGTKTDAIPEMSVQEIRQRLYALFAVFGVVIFFWFSFHQNGLTLTMFARDYTDLSGIAINLGFVTIEGAEIFQSVNPLFIVLLTPIVVGFFGWLRAKGMEPSTPKKIAIGMGIAATAYLVMTLGSLGLPAFETIDPAQDGTPLEQVQRVTPFLLIGTYLILTIAELFISPLGISFVSKVAPPQYQGIMQGGWLGATAVGNQLLFIGAILYESVPLWLTWTMFVVVCVMSMATMFFMLRWLERITKS